MNEGLWRIEVNSRQRKKYHKKVAEYNAGVARTNKRLLERSRESLAIVVREREDFQSHNK